jgi:hypothetical protein
MRLRHRQAVWLSNATTLLPLVAATILLISMIADGLAWPHAVTLALLLAASVVPVVWIHSRAWRWTPRDPEFGRLRRAVEHAADRLDGQFLVSEDAHGAVSIRVKGGTRPSITRVRRVDLAAEPGHILFDTIILMPWPYLVLHYTGGIPYTIDEQGRAEPKPGFEPDRKQALSGLLLTLRTGLGTAGTDELRELRDHLATARPDDGFDHEA